jgi:hypothetical protein
VEQLVAADVRNNSAWNQRAWLLQVRGGSPGGRWSQAVAADFIRDPLSETGT